MAGAGQNLHFSNMPRAATPAAPAAAASGHPIQSYSLFGESRHLPDVLHCETIAERSVLHGWELAPHRHTRLHQLLLITSGGGVADLDGERHALAPGALINVPPGHVHAFRFEPHTQGWVATLADELLDEIFVRVGDVRRTLARPAIARADARTAQAMAQIWEEFCGRAPARALVLRGLRATLLGWAARAVADGGGAGAAAAAAAAAAAPDSSQAPGGGGAAAAAGATAPAAAAAESTLVQRLHDLIEAHFLEHWQVADYARALAVSPTHLSRVARAATGVPAQRLVEARLMREARRNLAYTHLSVATIAYTLGYTDPAYFSRAFTRDAGVSPRAFRAQVAGEGRNLKMVNLEE